MWRSPASFRRAGRQDMQPLITSTSAGFASHLTRQAGNRRGYLPASVLMNPALNFAPSFVFRQNGAKKKISGPDDINGAALNPASPGSVRKFETGAHFEAGTRSSLGPLDCNAYAFNAAVPGMVKGKFGTLSVLGRYHSCPVKI